jgi:hypothetical protein
VVPLQCCSDLAHCMHATPPSLGPPLAPRLAFFPPQPPTYEVSEHQDSTRELYIKPLIRWVTDHCPVGMCQ